jgi:uncharacterized protein
LDLLAFAAGHGHPSALFDLANSYETGCGVAKDEIMAFQCYLKAALLGDGQSIFEVGRCFFHGIGISKDENLANACFDVCEIKGVEFEEC